MSLLLSFTIGMLIANGICIGNVFCQFYYYFMCIRVDFMTWWLYNYYCNANCNKCLYVVNSFVKMLFGKDSLKVDSDLNLVQLKQEI